MLNFIKRLVIKQWLGHLYVTGMVTRQEYFDMLNLTNYVGNVGRKFRPMLPKL